jgi:hypothetical protein
VIYGSVFPDARPVAYQPQAVRACLSRRSKGSKTVFQLLACNIACLAIASLYYAWRDVYLHRRKRARLNDRVAYMLWVAANRAA